MKRLFRGLLIFLVLFSVTGFFILPPIVKSVALKKLSEKLRRDVTIRTVKINPFVLSLTIEGFAVREPESKEIFASFDRLYLNFQSMSIIRKGIIVKEIRLVRPYAHIVRNMDLLYNFSDLLPKGEGTARKPLRFSLNNIEIYGGSADFFDRPEHTKHTIRDATLSIPFISNLPYYLDRYVQPSFSAKLNDNPVSFRGTSKLFAESHETNFEINIKDLDIPHYLAYVPFKLNYRLVFGMFDTQSTITYAQYKNRAPLLSLKGTSAFRNILVNDDHGKQILSLPQVNISILASEIMQRNIHFSKIAIESPEINIVRDKTGTVNISKEFSIVRETKGVLKMRAPVNETDKKPEKSAEAEKGENDTPAAVIEADAIVLAGGKMTFADLSENRNFRTALGNIQVKVDNFSTLRDKKASVEASLQTESGERVTSSGSFSVGPLIAEGMFEARQIPLKKYSPYYRNMVLFSVEEGTFDFLTKFYFQKAGEAPQIRLSEMAMDLVSFRLRKQGEKEDFLKVPVFSVKDSALDLSSKELVIGDIATERGMLMMKRSPEGTLNLQSLLPVSAAAGNASAQEKKPKAEKPWLITLKKVSAQQYTVRAEDQAVAGSVSLDFSRVGFKGENISTAKNAKGRVSMSLEVEKKGTVSASGAIGVDPLFAKLRLTAKAVPIMPVQPYFEDAVKIFVTDGNISLKGDVSLGYSKGKGMKVSYKGETALNNFASVDKINAEDFLKWDSLYFGGMDIGYAPLSVNIGEVALTDFYSRFIINPDGTLNVQDIIAKQGKKPEAEDTPVENSSVKGAKENQARQSKTEGGHGNVSGDKKETVPKSIRIDKVTLQGGTVNFSDHHIKPNYSANFLELGGRVSGLSSEDNSMADVELRGKLDNYAPLEISGKINPLRDDLYVDLRVDFKNMDLSPVTPYSARYAGYTIEKGKLSLALKYLIVKKKLDAQNRVFLDQLTLGDRVDSPEATKLPVKLAIALLKNRKGEIDLNLPVSGNLDDPKFSLGSVIIKIIVNLLVKAATSPFALLGAIFGGGGEELSYLDFDYGSAAVTEAGMKKLDALIKALYDRPALKLEIEGHADPEKDKESLRQYLFKKKLKAQKLKEMVKAGMTPVPVDEIKIDKNEYPKYLKLAYKAEKFPKPRNFLGIAKDLPVPEMEKLMLTHIEIKDDDLRLLASGRAQAAKDFILKSKQIEPERIFLIEAESLRPEKKEKLSEARVDFRLK